MNIEPGTVYEAIVIYTQRLDDDDAVAIASDTARLDVELLLCYVLKKTRAELILSHNYQLLPAEETQFAALFERRAQGEPVAYIVGKKAFWDMELRVTPDTLVPRPETELLVELAVQFVIEKLLSVDDSVDLAELYFCDVGTGSGAIALALAKEMPDANIVAIDKSFKALQCAIENARLLKVDNISWVQSDWLMPFEGQQLFTMVLANPPYIAEDDEYLEEPELQFEPRSALVSEQAGYRDLLTLIDQATWVLKRPGWLLLEHGDTQGERVRAAMLEKGYKEVQTFQDLADFDRVTIGHVASLF